MLNNCSKTGVVERSAVKRIHLVGEITAGKKEKRAVNVMYDSGQQSVNSLAVKCQVMPDN